MSAADQLYIEYILIFAVQLWLQKRLDSSGLDSHLSRALAIRLASKLQFLRSPDL